MKWFCRVHLCRVSGDAFLCGWFRVLPLLLLLENCGTPHLRLDACLSVPQHSKFSRVPLVLDDDRHHQQDAHQGNQTKFGSCLPPDRRKGVARVGRG